MPIIFCSVCKKKEYHEEIKNNHQGSIVPWHFHGFGRAFFISPVKIALFARISGV
jgi:hypothetical protein